MASSRISVPKRVKLLDDVNGKFPVVKNQGIDGDLYKGILYDLKILIEAGEQVPPNYYRKSPGTDYLLNERGWIHLHIDPNNDNILLIVTQTKDAVIFIALTDHSIFDEEPPGKTINNFMATKIAKAKLPSKPTTPDAPTTPPPITPTTATTANPKSTKTLTLPKKTESIHESLSSLIRKALIILESNSK
jgi:hypothetical protein